VLTSIIINENKNVAPGTIVQINKQGITVQTLQKQLLITLIHVAGKNKPFNANYYFYHHHPLIQVDERFE
jgi:methionyl-tRNA formyltransferase